MVLKYGKKALVSAATMLLFMDFFIPQSMASTLSDKQQLINQLQAESSQTYQQISQEQKQERVTEKSIQSYQSSIDTLKQSISQNQQQLRAIQHEINQLNEQISQTKVKLSQDESTLQQMVRATYEDGSVSYLAVLFQSTSFDDLLNRINALSTISQSQNNLVHEVAGLQSKLTSQEHSREAAYQTVKQKTSQLQVLESTNIDLQNRQKRALSQLKNNIQANTNKQNLLESQIHLTQAQIQQIEQQTAQAESLMQNQAYVQQATQNLTSTNTQALIQYAESFVGLPYVWGGTTPSPGFDCSGFTQYVFAHFGINISRTSEEQFAEGVPVSQSQLQPGDLVFFSTYAPGASHVGIYIGNGMMVDSEDAGLMITNIFSNSYWAPRYIGARDFIKH